MSSSSSSSRASSAVITSDPGHDPDLAEIGHCAFTSHPSGAVISSVKCRFLSSSTSTSSSSCDDIVVVKSNRLEVRRSAVVRNGDDESGGGTTSSTSSSTSSSSSTTMIPIVLTLPINGRIVAIAPVRIVGVDVSDRLFLVTEDGSYALISHDPHLSSSSSSSTEVEAKAAAKAVGEHYPVTTHASGRLPDFGPSSTGGGGVGGGGGGHRAAECGPLLAVDPHGRCLAVHAIDGRVTIFPICKDGWTTTTTTTSSFTTTTKSDGGGRTTWRRRCGDRPRPLGDAIDLRIEERTVLSMTFLEVGGGGGGGGDGDDDNNNIVAGLPPPPPPTLALLHQDCRGYQHVVSHGIDLAGRGMMMALSPPNDDRSTSIGVHPRGGGGGGKRPATTAATTTTTTTKMTLPRLSLSRIDGGSGVLIAVPPLVLPPPPPSAVTTKKKTTTTSGGVLILGQSLVTYHSPSEGVTLKANTGGAGILLSWCRVVDDDKYRDRMSYLIGDEHGRLHLLSLMRDGHDGDGRNSVDGGTTRLCLETLGTTTTSSSLSYLGNGRVFVGSAFGNSQLVRILDSPVVAMTTTGAGTANVDANDEDYDHDVVDGSIATGGVGGLGKAEDDPLADTTYVQVLEEYDNLGPIVDFDLRPCGDYSSDIERRPGGSGCRQHRQSLVVTCSGVGKDGTVRVVRNGVGMREHAAVEMGGIVGMWSMRRKSSDVDDSFLVQSFVGETRVLGVQSVKDVVEMEDDDDEGGVGGGGEEKSEMELEEEGGDEGEDGGALAEVTIPGFNSLKSTLFAGNLMVGKFDLLLQVVEDGVRLVDSETLALVAEWSPLSDSDEGSDDDDDEPMGFITVASANESGQIIVALRGGVLVYLLVQGGESSSSSSFPTIRRIRKVTLDREISCVDLNPFRSSSSSSSREYNDIMDIDGSQQPKTRESRKSQLVAVGLWDDFSVRLLNLVGDSSSVLEQVLHINLGRGSGNEGTSQLSANDADPDERLGDSGQHMMARSLCLVTMDSHVTTSNFIISKSMKSSTAPGNNADMLLVGLGDGKLISFVVNQTGSPSNKGWSIHARKEVSLGTQGVHLIPFQHGSSKSSRSCVLATGDRPTVVYLTGGNTGSNSNPKLNYSTVSLTVDDDDEDVGHASHKNISVNVAAPFRSSLLFSSANAHNSSICVADDSTLRLGTIDNIQKLHVTSFKLGMTPRRIAYHEAGRVYCVGCIAEMDHGGEANQNNCVRFFDDSTFDELNCITLEPFEMILSIESVVLGINMPPVSTKSRSTDNATLAEYRPFIVMGTAFAYPDEDEPSHGRVLVIECSCGRYDDLKSDSQDEMVRQVRQVADLPLTGGIYSIAPFYGGNILVTCGSDTIICQLAASILPREHGGESGELILNRIGTGHHGHLISLCVKSLVSTDKSLQKRRVKKQLAIVGDLMRSISLIEYYPKHQVIEELASDFNSNFCTDVAMLTDNIYMGSEGHNNLFVLRYNPNATTEQARCRLDTVGQYHLGENVNKMIGGSLVMPSNSATCGRGAMSASGTLSSPDETSPGGDRKVDITIGSQTLYGTVDGTIGSVLGLGGKTYAFLSALQRAMNAIVRPVGDLSHSHFRAWRQDQNRHGACGFVDGDWIETFLDLNRPTMEQVVEEMNADPRWSIKDDGKGFDRARDGVRQNLIDTDEGMGADPPSASNLRTLSVEDVLGAVEELSMLH